MHNFTNFKNKKIRKEKNENSLLLARKRIIRWNYQDYLRACGLCMSHYEVKSMHRFIFTSVMNFDLVGVQTGSSYSFVVIKNSVLGLF